MLYCEAYEYITTILAYIMYNLLRMRDHGGSLGNLFKQLCKQRNTIVK